MGSKLRLSLLPSWFPLNLVLIFAVQSFTIPGTKTAFSLIMREVVFLVCLVFSFLLWTNSTHIMQHLFTINFYLHLQTAPRRDLQEAQGRGGFHEFNSAPHSFGRQAHFQDPSGECVVSACAQQTRTISRTRAHLKSSLSAWSCTCIAWLFPQTGDGTLFNKHGWIQLLCMILNLFCVLVFLKQMTAPSSTSMGQSNRPWVELARILFICHVWLKFWSNLARRIPYIHRIYMFWNG